MSINASLVKNIDVSGNSIFFQEINKIITELKANNLPIEIKLYKPLSYNDSYIPEDDDEGLITIDLLEPINGVKAVLFHVISNIYSEEAIVQRFRLSANRTGNYVLGVTFAMRHPDFAKALKSEIEKLIGQF